MKPAPRQLTSEEEVIANLIVGADSLVGADVRVVDSGSRLIVDQYPLERVQLPPAYHDARAAQMRTSHGANPEIAREVRSYIDDYGLLAARENLATTFADADETRREFLDHLGDCVQEMAKLAIAKVENTELPPFDRRWEAAIGKPPALTNSTQLRDNLRAALSSVGIDVSNDNLREGLDRWEHRVGMIEPDKFAGELRTELDKLLTSARQQLFKQVGLNVDDIPFDGMQIDTFNKPDSHVSGSSLYIGGLYNDGNPSMQSRLQLNSGHPVTRLGLSHLAAHEGIPGHYVDAVLSELMWLEGKVGFEAVTSTMCTRDTVLREGWAQNTLPAIFGGPREALEALGPDFAVEMAVERLVDAAKNDGVILAQRDGIDKEVLKKQLAASHVLSDMFVRKILGWANHDVIGSMYAGAYLRGATAVEDAIAKYGVPAVAKLCLHQNGYHDVDTFEKALKTA